MDVFGQTSRAGKVVGRAGYHEYDGCLRGLTIVLCIFFLKISR